MNGDVSIPPLRDLPPARLAERREHLLSEIAQPPSRSPLPRRGLLAVPTVVAIAVAIVAGAALLATPALGIGDRLLSLIQGKPTRLDVQAPAWSHDGRTIVFVSWRDGNGEVYAMDADSSSPRNLTQDPAQDVRPAWSPDGRRIAFVTGRGRQLRGLRHERRRERKAEPHAGSGERRLSNLVTRRAEDRVPARAARRPPPASPVHHLPPLCRERRRQRAAQADTRFTEGTPERGTYQLVWSPDGRTIYFGRYLVRTDGSGARRLPYLPLTAVWSPDGTRIAFARKPRLYGGAQPGPCCYSAHSDIYVMNADGSGTRKLTHNARQNAEPAWSPDGRKIAFRSTRNGNRDIYVMNADGSGKRNLTRNAAWDSRPSWSPDGRKIAFVSNRDGRLEAHVMNADGSGQRSLTPQER